MSNIINKIRLSGTDYTLSATTSGITSGEVETMISAATSGYTARFAEDEEVTAAALNDLNERISGISGNNVVELTQAEYDALVSGGTVDPTAFYIITDATAGDLTNYYTKSETNTLLNGKQATLVSGTNIKTINNESILGSGNIDIQGGSTYTAGRGISIANDTISFSLPISAGTGSGSVIMGKASKVKASGNNSFAGGENSSATTYWAFSYGAGVKAAGSSSVAFGYSCYANSNQNFICGYNNNTNNDSEFGCGKYNISNTGSTASAQTLFSVGNGTSSSARHNAFEIRQNGDIYLSLNGQDVKLQDQLGGGEVSSAITSGDTNAVAGGAVYDKFDEVEQVTAAALNTLNDNFGGLKLMKLTQNEYNALSPNYDSNTLYVIVN